MAGRFAALNLAYYLMECNSKVRRILDEPKRATYTDLELTHYRQRISGKEEEKNRGKIWGMVPSPMEKNPTAP